MSVGGAFAIGNDEPKFLADEEYETMMGQAEKGIKYKIMSDAEQIPVKGFCSAVLFHRKIEVVLPALFRHRKASCGYTGL